MKRIATAESRLSHPEYDSTEFQRLLDDNGYVYLSDVPEDFDHLAFLTSFGELMPQYDGRKVWSVKAEERFEHRYHSLNSRALLPHTECYEFPGVSPKYLGLWGIVQASDGGGQTTLADSRGFLTTLSSEEKEQLSKLFFDFFSADGVLDMKLGRTATHPLYELRQGRDPIFRFSHNNVKYADEPFLIDVRERVVRYFEEHHVAADIEPHAILLWNNHRMLHSRNAYTDKRRHLRRVWLAER